MEAEAGMPARDILSRLRSLDQLEVAHAQMMAELTAAILDRMPYAVVACDPEGVIAYANEYVGLLFGHNSAALIGQPLEILIPERFRPAHPNHRSRFWQQPRVRPMGMGMILAGRRKNGSEFPVEIMLSPFTTTQGPFVMAVIRIPHEKASIAAGGTEAGASVEEHG